MADLKRINGVEVFAAGEWNGDAYSEADLDEMVRAFQETSKTFRPPLKLGHDDNQTLLQQDGLPAAGWIGRLYRVGKKLVADFVDIPDRIYDLLTRGAYRKVSAEIYWDARVGDARYGRLLSAVALLGADLPAVSTLADILAQYRGDGVVKHYDLHAGCFMIKSESRDTTTSPGEPKMANEKSEAELRLENELKAERDKAAAAEAKLKTYEQDIGDRDKEIEDLRTFKKDADTRISAAEAKLQDAQVDREIAELQGEKLVSKAMRPLVHALLSADAKQYTLKVGDADKTFSKAGLLKEILKLHAAAASVNFVESSEAGKVAGDGDEKALDSEIQQYAKEHDCSYAAAYRAVVKTKQVS